MSSGCSFLVLTGIRGRCHLLRVALALCVVVVTACVSLPRARSATVCDGRPVSSMVVTVTTNHVAIPFAVVSVTSGNRAIKYQTTTSSSGEITFPMKSGSYSVGIGDSLDRWQSAQTWVTVRPGCVVMVSAELIRKELDPNSSR